MKKTILATFLLTNLLLIIASCKKNPDIDIESFEIKDENVSIQTNSAVVSGSYSFSGSIENFVVLVSENETLSPEKTFEATLKDNYFSAELIDLRHATTYYYCYSVDFGLAKPYKTETKSFTTSGDTPTVVIMDALTQDSVTFKIKCEVTSDCGYEVIERGICWNTYGNPDMDDDIIKHNEVGIGQYTIRMSNLSPGTTYFVRAYAKNSKGVGLSEVWEFKTGMEATTPSVSTLEINNITYHSAVCNGEVISNGGMPLTERGICWGIEPEPTVNVHLIVAEGTATGPYFVTINSLMPGTTYHVRCYATNEKGISYGEDLAFTTEIGSPTVTTSDITNITTNSAIGGGNVTDQGASPVTERGICWSTDIYPTINDYYSISGMGGGEFDATLSELLPGTTYHVRAYAINAQELSYGPDKTFTTIDIQLPSVTTREEISNLTYCSASVAGEVTNDGGATVTERGFCWNTIHDPTIMHNNTICGSGIGNFSATLNGLSPSTTYYVRAYAVNSKGIQYGEERTFITLSTSGNILEGAIDGLFSIGPNSQVYFSKGNLQYDGASNTWKFADNQWDVIGTSQANNMPSQQRDLFGWGTSGFDHGAVCYQPWSTSQENAHYYAYNNSHLNLYDNDGKAEWGYNPISNSGNQLNFGWRTLTSDEWQYVFNTRYTASGIRFVKAVVNDVKGVILLPDNWNASYYPLLSVNSSQNSFTLNIINETDWLMCFEVNGAVFLPTTGNRSGTNVSNIAYGNYWSASVSNIDHIFFLQFNTGNLTTNREGYRCLGHAVRLVYDL